MSKKKKVEEEELQERYKGVTYVSVQSSYLPEEFYKHLEEFIMNLHKCRILTYTTIQSGKPPGCGTPGNPCG